METMFLTHMDLNAPRKSMATYVEPHYACFCGASGGGGAGGESGGSCGCSRSRCEPRVHCSDPPPTSTSAALNGYRMPLDVYRGDGSAQQVRDAISTRSVSSSSSSSSGSISSSSSSGSMKYKNGKVITSSKTNGDPLHISESARDFRSESLEPPPMPLSTASAQSSMALSALLARRRKASLSVISVSSARTPPPQLHEQQQQQQQESHQQQQQQEQKEHQGQERQGQERLEQKKQRQKQEQQQRQQEQLKERHDVQEVHEPLQQEQQQRSSRQQQWLDLQRSVSISNYRRVKKNPGVHHENESTGVQNERGSTGVQNERGSTGVQNERGLSAALPSSKVELVATALPGKLRSQAVPSLQERPLSPRPKQRNENVQSFPDSPKSPKSSKAQKSSRFPNSPKAPKLGTTAPERSASPRSPQSAFNAGLIADLHITTIGSRDSSRGRRGNSCSSSPISSKAPTTLPNHIIHRPQTPPHPSTRSTQQELTQAGVLGMQVPGVFQAVEADFGACKCHNALSLCPLHAIFSPRPSSRPRTPNGPADHPMLSTPDSGTQHLTPQIATNSSRSSKTMGQQQQQQQKQNDVSLGGVSLEALGGSKGPGDSSSLAHHCDSGGGLAPPRRLTSSMPKSPGGLRVSRSLKEVAPSPADFPREVRGAQTSDVLDATAAVDAGGVTRGGTTRLSEAAPPLPLPLPLPRSGSSKGHRRTGSADSIRPREVRRRSPSPLSPLSASSSSPFFAATSSTMATASTTSSDAAYALSPMSTSATSSPTSTPLMVGSTSFSAWAHAVQSPRTPTSPLPPTPPALLGKAALPAPAAPPEAAEASAPEVQQTSHVPRERQQQQQQQQQRRQRRQHGSMHTRHISTDLDAKGCHIRMPSQDLSNFEISGPQQRKLAMTLLGTSSERSPKLQAAATSAAIAAGQQQQQQRRQQQQQAAAAETVRPSSHTAGRGARAAAASAMVAAAAAAKLCSTAAEPKSPLGAPARVPVLPGQGQARPALRAHRQHKSFDCGTGGLAGAASILSGRDLRPCDYVLRKPYEDVRATYAFNSTELGSGQFGVIRECMEVATGHVYACKVINKSYIKGFEDAEDIRREVACLTLFRKHPTIVTLRNTLEDEKDIYIVMELCKGGDLFDRIVAKQRYSEAEAAAVCRSLVEALLHCHCLGVMHRDIKPENILLVSRESDTKIKLVDFGIATTFSQGKPLTEVMGTPEYMAPELLLGSYGPEADIWSAGVVLYITLSGVPPFWASSNRSIADAVLKMEPKLQSSRWANVSDSAKDLVRRMLVKDPRHRITAPQILSHPWICRSTP